MADVPTIAELTEKVEAELRAVFDSRRMPLYQMMSYHLGWEDRPGDPQPPTTPERSHGVACLAACYAAGGDYEVAAPAAACVELANGFLQIHDDVQDGFPKRGERDSVWWVWGPAQAINAGDGMHALARLAIFRLQERGVSPAAAFRGVQFLDAASLELCEGRFQDLEAQERIDMSVEAYLRMASSKSGALYACAMKLGGLVASAEEPVVESLGVCGLKLGVAAQIRSDLRQLWPDESAAPPSSEVLNKKKLLPLVYALEKADLSEKRRLGAIYFKRVLEPEDVASVRSLLEELGVRDQCEGLAEMYREEAAGALDTPGISPQGASILKEMVHS